MATIASDPVRQSVQALPHRENLARTDAVMRFERGGLVYAMDGRVGTLRQVVVDVRTGVVDALVIRIDKGGESILVPPQGVAKTAGSAVFLNATRSQFEQWSADATRYETGNARKVDPKSLLRTGVRSLADARVNVLNAGRDFLETGVAPVAGSAATARKR
jgi:sporulation protein YlmC with PRC-barrel domain